MALTLRTGRWTVIAAALLGAATLLAGTPGSASAYDPVNVGSQTQCRYRVVRTNADGGRIGVLKRIVVTPPTLYGHFDFGPQPVGWRFVVLTSYRYWENGDWDVLYKSPLQMGTATPTEAAVFNTMLARIPAPDPRHVVQFGTAYRVELRMFWWYPEQQLLHSRVNYLVPNMREVVNGVPDSGLVMPCSYRQPFSSV